MEIGERSALCPNEIDKDEVSNIVNEAEKSHLKQATVSNNSVNSKDETSELSEKIPNYVELEENMYLFER